MQAVSSEFGEALTLKNMTLAALAELGWDKELQNALKQTMPEEDAEEVLEELTLARNTVKELRGYLMGGTETASSEAGTHFVSDRSVFTQSSEGGGPPVLPRKFKEGDSDWREIRNRVNTRWDQSKLDTPAREAEAYATEAAVQILKDKYKILYVNRNTPLEMKEPYTRGEAAPDKYLNQGPDIVAKPRSGGKPLVVEVKGSDGKLSLSSSLVRGQADGVKLTQPSLQWLRDRARPRYLNTMEGAESLEINEAARLLRRIISQNEDEVILYDAAWVGYGKGGTTLGKVTGPNGALEALKPEPDGSSGVNNWYVYTVETE
jgi:hypothetical protein